MRRELRFRCLDWRQSAKPFLKEVAEMREFLPGIAERLGDPELTTRLNVSQKELIRFMKDPTKFLQETINSLDDALKAALMLIYVHGGRLVVTEIDPDAGQLVIDLTGMKAIQIVDLVRRTCGFFSQTGEGRRSAYLVICPPDHCRRNDRDP